MKMKNINFQLPKLELPNIDFPKLKFPDISMPRLKIGNLKAKLPIIQGGMGVGISLSGLASSVASNGGIGIIAANAIGMTESDYFKNGVEANIRALKREIKNARSKTRGIIGVNIMVALNDFEQMLSTAISEKADLALLGAGLPLHGIPIDKIKESKIKILPIVSSARAAQIIFKFWKKKYEYIPDGLVVEGPMAGGHLGFKTEQLDDPEFKLDKLVPEVISVVKPFESEFGKKIPVIAAGGIFTGEDINRFLRLGAAGVQMGTRFVATEECDADKKFKDEFVKAKKKDVVIIKSPVGLPGRAIKNNFLSDVQEGRRKRFKCPWQCLENCQADKAQYCISIALNNARKGIMNGGYAFAGANAFRVKKIVKVKELIEELRTEFLSVEKSRLEILKMEFEKVKERLSALKNEYEETIDTGIAQLKNEYARVVQKGTDMFKEEIDALSKRIESIKSEYMKNYNLIKEIRMNAVVMTA